MTEHKQPEARAKQPGELLDQWNLIRAASQDAGLSRGDIAVLMSIVQRYWPKYGNGWATMEILEEMSGMSYRQVIRAVRRLTDAGYVSVLAKGRRGSKEQPGKGTVFLPDFSLGQKYRDTHVTSNKGDKHVTSNTVCPDNDVTIIPICSDTHVTPSYLPSPAYKAEEQVVRNIDTPDPLPAHGLTASASGSRDPAGFDLFWKHYPRKHQRSKAEAAWNKLAPDAELAAAIIDGARRLAAHYVEHPVDKKWIKQPANWLAGKGWTEDLPEIYVDAKQAAIAKKVSQSKAPAAAANSNEPPLVTSTPIMPKEPFKPWRKTVRIVSAALKTCDDNQPWLEVVLEYENGEQTEDSIWLAGESCEQGCEDYAFEQLERARELYMAADVPHDAEPSELIGATLDIAQFRECGSEHYCRTHEPREPRLPAGGFAELVKRRPLELHTRSFAAAIGSAYADEDEDEDDKSEDDFDMDDFIARAKKITGEAA